MTGPRSRGLVFAILLALASRSYALSTTEIQAKAREITAANRRDSTETSPVADQTAILKLGELVLAFVDQSEQAARTGADRRSELKATFDALWGPLNGLYEKRGNYLEAEQKQVMEEDGDLEALIESKPFREAQTLAVQALYYLNWLNFYGGRLHDGARKKELLESAEKGFSDFAASDKKDLAIESLLGRGLCNLELGQTDPAARDFKLVIEDPAASAERRGKAKLALLDAYSRGGRTQDSLAFSAKLLADGGLDPGDANVVRYVRLQTLFNALKTAGSEAGRYRGEATILLDQLRRAGKSWAEKADALMFASIDNPAQWVGKAETPAAKWELANLLLQKGDDATAVPLLEAVIASTDPNAREHHAEAHYFLGVARFKTGDFVAAEASLKRAVADPKPEWAAEAAFLHFKSLEALMATQPTDEMTNRYVEGLENFLAANPQHKSVHEVRYRLGEILQSQAKFEAAVREYAQVTGDPVFEIRATFGALQSRFELLKAGPSPSARTLLLTEIGQGIERYNSQAAVLQKKDANSSTLLSEFGAKVALLQAVHLSLTDPAGTDRLLASLGDFEKRFPEQKDLAAQVVRLRIGTYQRSARFAEAEAEITRNAPLLKQEGKTEALEKLAESLVKAGTSARGKGDVETAKTAEQAALKIFEILDGGGDKQKLTMARLYHSADDFAQAETLYKEVLEAAPATLPALRGLASIAESRKQYDIALGHWKKYTEMVRPGDPPWYDGRYQQARLTSTKGDKDGACRQLKEMRAAMPGLGDSDLRTNLNRLYTQVCS